MTKKSRKPSVRLMGEGGSDKYYSGGGGRLNLKIPVSKSVTVTPYVEGYAGKEKGGSLKGKVTGGGIRIKKTF